MLRRSLLLAALLTPALAEAAGPTAALTVGFASGPAPLRSTFDTSAAVIESGQTGLSLLMPGNGDLLATVPSSYVYAFPGFYNASSWVSESPSNTYATSAPAGVAVSRVSDGLAPPTVSVGLMPTSDPLTLGFNQTVTPAAGDPIVARLWDFGDGTYDGQDATLHSFAASGIYQTTLTVTSRAGLPGVARTTVVIPNSDGSLPLGLLVGITPADARPRSAVHLVAYVVGAGAAAVGAAEVDWPGLQDTSPTVTKGSDGQVVIGSEFEFDLPGHYDVPVSAVIGSTTVSGLAHLTVGNGNGSPPSPVLLAPPNDVVVAGGAYQPNGTQMTLTGLLLSGNGPFSYGVAAPTPANVSVDASGNIQWTPTAAQVGAQRLAITVTDVDGQTQTFSWVVNVIAPFKGGCSMVPGAASRGAGGLVALVLLLAVLGRRRARSLWLLALVSGLNLVAGCGGSSSSFSVNVLLSPYEQEDPLAGVDTLQLRLSADGQTTASETVKWTGKSVFPLHTHLPAAASGAQLTLTALVGGRVVAVGRSAPLGSGAKTATLYLGLVNQLVSVPFGPPAGDPRFGASSTVLADGRVLIVGGATSGGPRTPDAAAISALITLYDPALGSFIAVAGGSFAARIFHAAVATPDGNALIVGGLGRAGGLNDIVRFDATTNQLAVVGTLPAPRYGAAAVGFVDGGLLLVGGYSTLGGPPLGDGVFLRNGNVTTLPLPDGRAFGFATGVALANGDALVAGGLDASGNALADALVYSGVAGGFVALAPGDPARAAMLAPRLGHTLTTLANGNVLVYGGSDGQSSMAEPELYRPSLGGFTTVGPYNLPERERHAALTLPDGSALLIGGEAAPSLTSIPTPVRPVLHVVPRPDSVDLVSDLPPAPARADGVASLLRDGSIFYSEGAVGSPRALAGGAQLMVPCFDSCLTP